MEKQIRRDKSGPTLRLAHAAFAGCLALAAQYSLAGDAATPLEVFGRLPTLEHIAISPDGAKLAFVRTKGDERSLLIKPVDKSEIMGGVRVGSAKLRGVEWMDDDNLLSTISSTEPPPLGFTGPTREWYQLAIYNLPKNKINRVTFDVGSDVETFNVVIGDTAVRTVNGQTTLFAPGYYVTDRTMPAMFSFVQQRPRLLDRGPEPNTDWLIDESGNLAAQFVYHDSRKAWEIKARKENHWTQVASGTAAVDMPDILGFNADGSAIIVRFVENGEPIWKPLNLKDNTWGPPIDRSAKFSHIIQERKSGRIIGGIRDLGDSQYTFFDNELQAHWNAVLRSFPNARVRLASNSDDYSKMVVEVFGRAQGYVYALYDWYEHRAIILGEVYQGLTTPAEVRPISYRAADGMTIPGFLTLPPGVAEKNLPLIVFPHGGPAAADTLEFDWWAQAMAAQGYAVLQPNFRGSTLDSRFLEAGFGEWGRKMQTDLSDGVRYLASQGVVDPKRVCIVGGSYGGYAALAGVTLDPGVYRCAVSVAGISDLRRMRRWIGDNSLGWSQRYWDRFIGTSDKNDPALLAISPIEHVSAVTAPVLLIHGRDDTVVPFEQSDVMESALKHAGKAVELVTMKHEDHWLSHGETRLQMLEACVRFLKANNPPD
ncbi:MAG TPA: S9 family peptidase [Steroidobacteraceae bacterium]|jgi:dipeptidyl aminopeptidase/acylaminoacyl peptidase